MSRTWWSEQKINQLALQPTSSSRCLSSTVEFFYSPGIFTPPSCQCVSCLVRHPEPSEYLAWPCQPLSLDRPCAEFEFRVIVLPASWLASWLSGSSHIISTLPSLPAGCVARQSAASIP